MSKSKSVDNLGKSIDTPEEPVQATGEVKVDADGVTWVTIRIPVGPGPLNGYGELAHKPYSRVREHILRREEGLALWRLRDGIEVVNKAKLLRKEEVVSVFLRLVWDQISRLES